MGDTSIEWTDVTWNPVRGCSRVSPGCGGSDGGGCYAERMAHRFSGKGRPYEGLTRMTPGGPRWTGKIRLVPEELDAPLHWKKPRRVFVNSMSDLFHDGVDDYFIARVFATMHLAFWHTYQTLTKRAERMRDLLGSRGFQREVARTAAQLERDWNRQLSRRRDGIATGVFEWPLRNAWMGVSVENQAAADERIPHLLATPAAVRFLSCEPLLGPVDLRCMRVSAGIFSNVLALGESIRWVIAGSESGPGARTMDEAWVRSLRDQCTAAGVPFFYKQRLAGGRKVSLPELDGRVWAEIPGALR